MEIDTYTKSLLHFNGSDTSTTFIDEIGKSWTAAGHAQLDTSDKQFGTASGLFDGNGDYISTPNTADFNFGAGDFTIDFWFKTSSTTRYVCFISNESGTSAGFTILMNKTSSSAGDIAFYGFGLSTADGMTTSTTGYNNGNWHHCAVVRNGTNFKIYIDGTSRVSVTDAGTLTNTTAATFIGFNNTYSGRDYAGWIDEFRISKGIARWTADFTPPTSEYGNNIKKINGVERNSIRKLNRLQLSEELFCNPLFSDANLKFYWRLEGNANDASPNGLNGTPTNVTFGTSYGKFGQGGLFATNSKIVGGYTFTSGQAVTIMAWVYSTETTSKYRNVMDTINVKPMIWFDVNGKIEFDAGSYRSPSSMRNQWVHTAIVHPSGNSTPSYYINGVAVGTGTAYSIPANKPTWFFRASSDGTENWVGYADEVVVFDRELSSTEVSSIYNSQIKKFIGVSNI